MGVADGAGARVVIPPIKPKATEATRIAKPEIYPAFDPSAAAIARYSTAKAIERGRGAAQYDVVLRNRDNTREEWDRLATAMDFERATSPSLTDAYPKLDINAFAGAAMSKGNFIARTLCWGERGEGEVEILFLVDWRNRDPIIFAVHEFSVQEHARWQRLQVTFHASRRVRWLCPVRGKNADALYLRGGWLASREAQRLVSPSQRAAGRQVKP